MTINEFGKILGLIRGAFPHIDRFRDDDVKDVWYECLSDLEFDIARAATINTIKAAKDFPPDIAKIREEYDYLAAEKRRNNADIKEYYTRSCNSYPMEVPDGYGWEEWQSRVNDGEQAKVFNQVIKQYINECNEAGEDVIDFLQCVKTICRDSDKKIFFKEAE